MRKFTFNLLILFLAASYSFAGGIVTNTNQSSAWVRLLVRDATTEIDAVYFNPAGLTKLNDGFHFSISNQYITQGKEVLNNYSFLNDGLYEGVVKAPIFPDVYAAYKTGNVVFSLGFNPIGGGGGATFDSGLPSFEMGISDLVPGLESVGVKEYSLNTFFEGTSIYFGLQAGVSYALSDEFSVFIGGRYVSATNTYNGYLKDVTITFNDNSSTTATKFFNDVAETYTDAGMTVAAAESFAKAKLLDDQEADVKQKGWGLTTIIGFNYSPTDDLNIGFKYESATKLELKNETAKDFTVGYTATGVPITMFPEGEINRADMPAMISLGVDYQILSKLSVTSGFHYYFDKSANYGRSLAGVAVKNEDVIDKNYWELGLGLEYALTDQLFVSAGYLTANSGVSEDYQTDLSYSLSSNTFGGGLKYALSEKMALNLGVGYTFYKEGSRVFNHLLDVVNIPVKESYTKDNLIIGVGFDFSF